MGMAFAFAWTPCIGPVLGSVLALAAGTGGSATGGIALLLAYSLGLGVPFLLIGLAFGRMTDVLARVRGRLRWVDLVGGAVLVVFGILLLTGNVDVISGHISSWLHDLHLTGCRSAERPSAPVRRPGACRARGPGPAWLPGAHPRSMGPAMAPAAPPHPAVSSATPSRCRDGSPSSPASISRSPSGETVLVEGPNGAGQDQPAAGVRRPGARWPRGGRGARPRPGPPTGARCAAGSGLLAHASHLYDDLTVRENVRFAVRAAGADPDRIDAACDRWGLTGRLLQDRRAPSSRPASAAGWPWPC